jgi:hypothetical protein
MTAVVSGRCSNHGLWDLVTIWVYATAIFGQAVYHDLGAVTGQLQRDRATDPGPHQRTLPFNIPSTGRRHCRSLHGAPPADDDVSSSATAAYQKR